VSTLQRVRIDQVFVGWELVAEDFEQELRTTEEPAPFG
jgi:hypothetical protein